MWRFKKQIYKTVTEEVVIPPNTLFPAYLGTNCIKGIVTSNFFTTRNNGELTQSGTFSVGCVNSSGNYSIHRMYCGFDTSSISGATSGVIKINISGNSVFEMQSFVFVRTEEVFPANHAWTVPDYDEPVNMEGAAVTDPLTLGGITGVVSFNLTPSGIAYINANPSFTIVLVQRNNDLLDLPPSPTSAQFITGDNSGIELTYL